MTPMPELETPPDALPPEYILEDGADALVIMTDWQEFRTPDFELIGRKLNQHGEPCGEKNGQHGKSLNHRHNIAFAA